jgi:hypothetical protein
MIDACAMIIVLTHFFDVLRQKDDLSQNGLVDSAELEPTHVGGTFTPSLYASPSHSFISMAVAQSHVLGEWYRGKGVAVRHFAIGVIKARCFPYVCCNLQLSGHDFPRAMA